MRIRAVGCLVSVLCVLGFLFLGALRLFSLLGLWDSYSQSDYELIMQFRSVSLVGMVLCFLGTVWGLWRTFAPNKQKQPKEAADDWAGLPEEVMPKPQAPDRTDRN